MALADVRRAALEALRPPPRLALSDWLEANVRLPEGTTALPGPLRLWPYQREIADAIGDPTIERVTICKPVRVGFTCLLAGSVAAACANDPAPILCLLPTESDARDFVVSDLEPLFAATPAVAGMLSADVADDGARNTLLHRRFPGGSLKVVASKAPRNLRRHTAKVLLIDEADAMTASPEGSPILLGEKRTLSFADRKIVLGSTPLDEETSQVLRAYAASDGRVYEVPCPACGAFSELLWGAIEWEDGKPETAAWRCPARRELVPETAKPAMVAAGRWRPARPEVQGHAGFRLNALVSGLANATWPKLAAEFLRAKDDSDELQVFVNTILGQGWRSAAVEVDEHAIAARAERFGLDAIPADVLVVTVGTDVQDDRLESTVVGWSRTEPFVLGHVLIWGSPDLETTWREHDELLRTQWKHPAGGTLTVDAALVDSGDGDWTEAVYSYAFPRIVRRVFASKGLAGTRPIVEPSRSKLRGGGRLMLLGVDTIKTTIYDRCARAAGLRFSDSLPPVWYEQLASERKVVRYVRGQPMRRFERKPGARAEALDCLVMAWAARQLVTVDLDGRSSTLEGVPPPPASDSVPSPWVAAW